MDRSARDEIRGVAHRGIPRRRRPAYRGQPIPTSRGEYYPPPSGLLSGDGLTIPMARGAPGPYDADIGPPQLPTLPPLPNQGGGKASQAADVDDGTGASPEGKDRRSTSSRIDDVARGLAPPSSRSKKGKPKRTPPPQPEPEFEFVGPPAPVSIRTLSGEEAEEKRSETRRKRLKTFIGDIWDWLSDPEREWEEEQERMRRKWSTSAGARKRG